MEKRERRRLERGGSMGKRERRRFERGGSMLSFRMNFVARLAHSIFCSNMEIFLSILLPNLSRHTCFAYNAP
jgi:hypothetical protein